MGDIFDELGIRPPGQGSPSAEAFLKLEGSDLDLRREVRCSQCNLPVFEILFTMAVSSDVRRTTIYRFVDGVAKGMGFCPYCKIELGEAPLA
jgi:hypothetical protein